MTAADVTHAVDAIGRAAAADGDGDAQGFGAVPQGVATRVVGLGLALQADAPHPALVGPVGEPVGGVGGGRVQDADGDGARGVLPGAVALVGVVKAVGAVGLDERGALHAGVVHLLDEVRNVVADLEGPAAGVGMERVSGPITADHMGMGVDNHGRNS